MDYFIGLFQIDRIGNMTMLAIKEAFPEDSGLITCRARNCAGVAECSAEFYVQGMTINTVFSFSIFIIKLHLVCSCILISG